MFSLVVCWTGGGTEKLAVFRDLFVGQGGSMDKDRVLGLTKSGWGI